MSTVQLSLLDSVFSLSQQEKDETDLQTPPERIKLTFSVPDKPRNNSRGIWHFSGQKVPDLFGVFERKCLQVQVQVPFGRRQFRATEGTNSQKVKQGFRCRISTL